MARLVINADLGKTQISKHIYGHFAEHLGRCVYEGIWVGEDSAIPNTRGMRNDVIDALKKLSMPNLRWPGGCFADTYHWKDGIGPREKRPSIVNVHWGGTVENNHFGTHEFYDFCDLIQTEPYICGNVGSGTVQEMAEWLEYITMPAESPMSKLRRANGRDEPWPIKYWAVGNENWGCGGTMTALQYAWEFRKYQGYCRHFGGKKLYKIACGLNDEWNEILLKEAHQFIDGLSVHYYTVPGPWQKKGSATDFTLDEWKTTMQRANHIDDFIRHTSTIMDRYDPARRIGIIMDEWGTWFDVEPGTNPGFLYQQNTIRDALVAGLSLNVFNAHAGRVHMANIAQTINVLQAMILTEGERMLLTPTYHVFEMYKVHQDATLLPSDVECETYVQATAATVGQQGAQGGGSIIATPQVSASASRDANGKTHVSLCNLHHDKSEAVTVDLRGGTAGSITGRVLTSPTMNAHNTFEKPDAVKPTDFKDFKIAGTGFTTTLPPRSVVVLELT